MNIETSSTQKPAAACFLLQGTYAPATWASCLPHAGESSGSPIDMTGLLHQFNVNIHSAWSSYGDYDFVMILELEQAVDITALLIALKAGWEGKAFGTLKATALLSREATTASFVKAKDCLRKCNDEAPDGPTNSIMDSTIPAFSK